MNDENLIAIAALVGGSAAFAQSTAKITYVHETRFNKFAKGDGTGISVSNLGGINQTRQQSTFTFSGCHSFAANQGQSAYAATWKSFPYLDILIPTGSEGQRDTCTLRLANLAEDDDPQMWLRSQGHREHDCVGKHRQQVATDASQLRNHPPL